MAIDHVSIYCIIELEGAKMKDLFGVKLELGQYVVTSENNRIVVARVVKMSDCFVWIEPVASDAGRRGKPRKRTLRKAEYNVSVLEERQITAAALRGCY